MYATYRPRALLSAQFPLEVDRTLSRLDPQSTRACRLPCGMLFLNQLCQFRLGRRRSRAEGNILVRFVERDRSRGQTNRCIALQHARRDLQILIQVICRSAGCRDLIARSVAGNCSRIELNDRFTCDGVADSRFVPGDRTAVHDKRNTFSVRLTADLNTDTIVRNRAALHCKQRAVVDTDCHAAAEQSGSARSGDHGTCFHHNFRTGAALVCNVQNGTFVVEKRAFDDVM